MTSFDSSLLDLRQRIFVHFLEYARRDGITICPYVGGERDALLVRSVYNETFNYRCLSIELADAADLRIGFENFDAHISSSGKLGEIRLLHLKLRAAPFSLSRLWDVRNAWMLLDDPEIVIADRLDTLFDAEV